MFFLIGFFSNWFSIMPISKLYSAAVQPVRKFDSVLGTKFVLLRNCYPLEETFENIKFSCPFTKSKFN